MFSPCHQDEFTPQAMQHYHIGDKVRWRWGVPLWSKLQKGILRMQASSQGIFKNKLVKGESLEMNYLKIAHVTYPTCIL